MTGKLSVLSLGRAEYFIVFLDASTAIISVYFIQRKSPFIEYLKAYKTLLYTQSRYKMQFISLEGAGEQPRNEVHNYLQQIGITWEYSPAYASQYNGSSERLIQ